MTNSDLKSTLDEAFEVARFAACRPTTMSDLRAIFEVLRERVDKAIAAPTEAAAMAATVPAELQEMEARKDAAYLERNQVVAALAKCFPSGTARTAIEGWSEDWHGCVYIDLPTGQASWHYHDSHAHLFADLPPYKGTWDGHDTPEKYARLARLTQATVADQPAEPSPAESASVRFILQGLLMLDEGASSYSQEAFYANVKGLAGQVRELIARRKAAPKGDSNG